ncbi:MAG: hypothetical protein WAV45_03370 [Propionibacteriaceae bacterium]|nr:carbamoylphosphate synthase large subunit [Micropruina sp.]
MTTFCMISPGFPNPNVYFSEHLALSGVTVLGIGDQAFETLPERLRRALTEYYKVDSLEDYGQVYRAAAYLAYRHGKLDWIESNNEYWLGLDAHLRTDFNVTTGHGAQATPIIRSKAGQKQIFEKAGIPTARQARVTDVESARGFATAVGYPLVAKPEFGIGAVGASRLDEDAQLVDVIGRVSGRYVLEEYVTGTIESYDAIVDGAGNPVFDGAIAWPPSVMDIVNEDLDLTYRILKVVPEDLRAMGRATIAAFGMRNRFVHLEFFRLTKARAGLGEVGDLVALEANMRPPGGDTPDMYNIARSTDVYQIYADLVTGRDSGTAARANDTAQFCVYAGRRDHHHYRVPREELMARYGKLIVRTGRQPEMFVPQMGNEFFLLRTPDQTVADAFVADALDRAS